MFFPPHPLPGVTPPSVTTANPGIDINTVLARLLAGPGGPVDAGDNPALTPDNIGTIAAGVPSHSVAHRVARMSNLESLNTLARARQLNQILQHLRQLRPAQGFGGPVQG